MHTKRSLLAATALVSALAAASGAYAQAAGNGNEIEELVVTAEKREQSLQDVPVAITAFTDERREVLGITNAQELTNFTPGLAYNTGNDRLTMRGIGRLTNNRASEGGVAMYVDNFYTSSVYAAQRSTLFIDRTEVLRGPQGTLYGRNAIGGAMNFITKRPTTDFYGEVRAQLGNYNTQQYEAAASGAILGDALRGRVAGSWFDQGEGFYKNVAGGPSEGGRGTVWDVEAQLDGKIGDRFDWWGRYERFNTDALGRGAGGRQGITTGPVPTSTALFSSSATTPTSAFAYYGRTTKLAGDQCDMCFESDTPNKITIRSETMVFQANLHLDGFDVRYIAGHTWYDYNLQTDVDGTANSTPFSYNRTTPGILPVSSCNPNGQAFLSTRNATTGVCSAPSFLIPASGQTVYPRLVNEYNEEPSWFSNELNFASTGSGPSHWLIGLYQFKEVSNYTPTDAREPDDARFATPRIASSGALAAANPTRAYAVATGKTRSNSYAVFGQEDYDIGEQFVVHAGLRYTWDKKTVVEGARLICIAAPSPACPAVVSQLTGGAPLDFTQLAVGTATLQPALLPNGQPNPNAGKPIDSAQIVNPFYDPTTGFVYRVLQKDWSGWGGTLGLDWKPDPDTLVYAKYSRGYKAGGFNATTTTLVPGVSTNSEKINAYEVGAKKTFFRTFQANVSAFYYDYKDIQAVMSTIDPILQTNTSLYVNLPKAVVKGFEIETIWQPIDHLQLNGTYAYLDAKVKESGCNKTAVLGAGCYQDPEDPTGVQAGVHAVAGSTATSVLQDLKGATLGASTPHRVAFNANYTIDEVLGGDVTLSGTYVWRSATYYSVFNRYYNRAKAWEQVDLRALWNKEDKKVAVIGFVKNLFDARGQIGMGGTRITNIGPNTGQIDQNISYVPPRQYGVEVQYRF